MPFFKISEFDYEKKCENKVTSSPERGIVCKDLKGLIDYITTKRGLDGSII